MKKHWTLNQVIAPSLGAIVSSRQLTELAEQAMPTSASKGIPGPWTSKIMGDTAFQACYLKAAQQAGITDEASLTRQQVVAFRRILCAQCGLFMMPDMRECVCNNNCQAGQPSGV